MTAETVWRTPTAGPGQQGPTDLLADYEYDYLDRLSSYQAYSGGSRTDFATYTYDALDRLASEEGLHPSFNGSTRTTQFSHLGVGAQLSQGDSDQLNPRNPFRYSAKHVDTGSGTLDMGVRRFGPDVSRF